MERWLKLLEMLKESPGDSFLQHALALEYIKQGQDQQARAVFEQLLAHDPDYLGSYYHLAKLVEKTGDYELAVAWYEKGMAVARKLKDTKAYNELQSALDEITD